MSKQVITILLLVAGICTVGFTQELITVVVNDIQSSSEEEARIAMSITESIKFRLSLEEQIELIEFDKEAQQDIKKSTRSIEEIESPETAQFLISGRVQQLSSQKSGDALSLQVTLFNVISRKEFFISTKPFTPKELFKSLEQISEDIVQTLLKNSTTIDPKIAAVMCFRIVDKSSVSSEYLANELQQSVYYNLPQAYSAVSPREVAEVCDQSLSSDLANTLDADVLIDAEIYLSRDSLVITPYIFLASEQAKYSLVPYATRPGSYKYYDRSDFAHYLNNALNALLGEDGSWQTDAIQAESSEEYKEIIALLNDRYISNELSDYNSISLAQRAVELNSEGAEGFYYFGQIFREQDDPYAAIEYFSYAIELNNKYSEAYIAKGETHSSLGEYTQALSTYLQGHEQTATKELKYLIGETYYFLDELERCIEWLEKVKNWQVMQREIDYYLSSSYYTVGSDAFYSAEPESLPVAADYLAKALPIAKESKYEVMHLLILTEGQLKNFRRCRNLIKQGLQEDFLRPTIYLDHARNLRTIEDPSTGGFDQAALREAIAGLKVYNSDHNDANAASYQLLGSSYFRLQELDSASHYYQKAIEYEPHYMGYKLDFAEVAIMNGQHELASQALDDALNLKSEGSRANGHRILIYYLKYCNDLLTGRPAKENMEKLERQLKAPGSKYLGWSFATFLRWLEQANINRNTKDDIQRLTQRLQTLK